MLAEFSRQIAEEKSAKEIEQQVKAAAYQEMLKGNAKVLERKKELKEADRQENLRLFQLQIEMAEKQARMFTGSFKISTFLSFCVTDLVTKLSRSACVQHVKKNDSEG